MIVMCEGVIFLLYNSKVYTVSDDASARIGNLLVFWPLQIISKTAGSFVKISPNNKYVISTSDGKLYLFDRDSGAILHTFDQNGLIGPASKNLSAPTFSPDSSQILTIDLSGLAQTWDAVAFDLKHTYKERKESVSDAVYSSDGKWVITACDDGLARIWDAVTGQLLGAVSNGSAVWHLAISENRKLLMASGQEIPTRVFEIVDPRKPMPIANLQVLGASGFDVEDGRDLALLSGGVPQISDTQTQRLLHTFVDAGEIINDFDISSDGKLALTAGDDKIVRIWDAKNGTVLEVLRGHELRVTGARFIDNYREVVSISNDGTVRMWDVSTGVLLATLRSHASAITSLDLFENGTKLATAGIDGTVRIWKLPQPIRDESTLVNTACNQTLKARSEDVNNLSVLKPKERQAAPSINPAKNFHQDGDVCSPEPPWSIFDGFFVWSKN